jgi:hypothetical protein
MILKMSNKCQKLIYDMITTVTYNWDDFIYNRLAHY